LFTNDPFIGIFDFLNSTHFQPNGSLPELGYNPKIYNWVKKLTGSNRLVATQNNFFCVENRPGWLRLGLSPQHYEQFFNHYFGLKKRWLKTFLAPPTQIFFEIAPYCKHLFYC
jgi:hypothetical protein